MIPSRLSEFVGQEQAKYVIGTMIEAAKHQRKPVGHLLLWGPPGLGKTTLARIIANETGCSICELVGAATRKQEIYLALVTRNSRVILIDEVHGLPMDVAEQLYSAMDEFTLPLGTVKLPIKPFTLVGTTTDPSLVPSALRSRFRAEVHLSYYSESALALIAARTARHEGIVIADDGATEIARRSRGTPRIARQLTMMVIDFAVASGRTTSGHGPPRATAPPRPITKEEVSAWLDPIVDSLGIAKAELCYLTALTLTFDGGPVGLHTIANAMGESPKSIASIVEPYLIRLGFLEITTSGRRLTPKGLGYTIARLQNGFVQDAPKD